MSIGFGDVPTRTHLYRAIIEGIAYALREGKELSEKKSGVKISSLKASGGAYKAMKPCKLPQTSLALPPSVPTHSKPRASL